MIEDNSKSKIQSSMEKAPSESQKAPDQDHTYLAKAISSPQRNDNSIATQQIAVAQAIKPLVSLASVENVAKSLFDATSFVPLVQALAEATTTDISGIEDSTVALATVVKTYQKNSEVITALNEAVKTPELLSLQKQIIDRGLMVDILGKFISDLSSTWQSAIGIDNLEERSMAAQNVAFLRLTPNYRGLELPWGGKKVIKSLTKPAAEKLTQMDEILFDPERRKFYHKDTPKQQVTADEISVAESALCLFEGITLDALISFESQLFDDPVFALDHPVGKKIFEIIQSWTEFIDFDRDTYYHARKLEKAEKPFLDQEMLKAPVNVPSHGRYNAIGKSCYYIADSLEGAVSEIRKHSGRTKPVIQVATIRPIKSIKLIDLSKKVSRQNNFIEHLRHTVDNEEGKIIKEYLLPNFVASCCKRLKIDGIKYLSTGYCCYVMWKDDYFEFVEGGRKILKPE